MEMLEKRELLAVTPIISLIPGGILMVGGSKAADVIEVVERGGEVCVFNGAIGSQCFLSGAVSMIKINAGGGNDNVLIHTDRPVAIFGGSGNDTVLSGGGNDVLDGGKGNDLLIGSAGNDILSGGAGNDILQGGLGEDIIDAGAGADALAGSDGNDVLFGGDGNDSISGENGNDVVNGSAGRDVLSGGAGDDSLDGGDGNDRLMGDAGNDTLSGGTGADRLLGGDGDDVLRLNQQRPNRKFVEILDGELGNDTLLIDLRFGLNAAEIVNIEAVRIV